MKLTAEIMKGICPRLDLVKAGEIANLHNDILPKYGMNDPNIAHEFIANEAHECGEFTTKEENLNYSEDRLKVIFKYYRDRPGQAKTDAHNPMQIANTVYDDKNRSASGKLGNTRPGDGYNLRGGGAIQITGRDMYQKYTDYVNKRDGTKLSVEEVAKLVRSDWKWAIDSACWVFAVEKKLIDEALADKIVATRKGINGGTNGLEEVEKYYSRAKQFIK